MEKLEWRIPKSAFRSWLCRFFLAIGVVWLSAAAAVAQPSEGYYRITNVGHPSLVMMEDFNVHDVKCVPAGADAGKNYYGQLWELKRSATSSSKYTLRNVRTGRYLQSKTEYYSSFQTGTNAADVTFSAAATSGAWLMNCGNYLHCDGQAVVIWWDTSSTGDHWTFEQVSLTDAEVAVARAEYASIESLQNDETARAALLAKLQQHFSGTACGTPTSSYDECVAAGLPAGICDYVKALADASAADRAWLDRFHRRAYKPYSNPDRWRDKLGTTCLTPMSNPTGIYTDEGEVLYVVVDEEVPANATLYLAGVTGNGIPGSTDGVALKKGVNAVLTPADGTQWYVLYLANTLDASGTTRLLSGFSPLDIHLMGGSVTGFLEVDPAKSEAEVNADYADLISRAKSGLNFVVKGEYSMFNFPKTTYDAIWSASSKFGAKIWKSIKWYDNVARWSWEIMGLCDAVKAGERYEESWATSIANHKEDYNVRQSFEGYWPRCCNNPIMAIQVADGVNPHSTGSYTAYPGVSGVESSFNAEREDFDNWCTAHEAGHNNQKRINLPSCTESSNNFFSDIVVYQYGYRGGRGGTVAQVNADYQNGLTFALRDIGSTHRMWYQLYLYYHVARKKPDFYPELFRLLREDPIQLASGQTGKDCFLHFYKKACQAAGEDLTDFFRVWGFFIPLDNVYFGDYANYTISMTQAEIDAAIAEVKAAYPSGDKSAAILLIDDRVQNLPRWDSNAADGAMRPDHWGGTFTEGAYGDHGDPRDFAGGSGAGDPSYSYKIEGSTVTVSGTGGVGFIVRDKEGNILVVSNANTFDVPLANLASGVTIEAIGADGAAAVLSPDYGDADTQAATLRNMLAKADELLAVSTVDGMQIGFYRRASLTDFINLRTEISEALEAGTSTSYSGLIERFNSQYVAVLLADDRVPFQPGAVYTLRSQGDSGYGTNNLSMTISNEVEVKGGEFSASDALTQWTIESASGRPGRYFIRNLSTGKYISSSAQSTQVKAEAADTASAISYAISEHGTGKFLLQGDHRAEGFRYLHLDGQRKVVGWQGEGSPASHWYLTQVALDEAGEALNRASNLAVAARALISGVTGSEFSAQPAEQAVTLQTTAASGRFYLSGGMNHSEEGQIGNLVDGSTSTYYHSDWQNASTEYHYLTVDTGNDDVRHDLRIFRLNYATRIHGSNLDVPKKMTVSGSSDGKEWHELAVLPDAHGNPMPQDRTGKSYKSNLIFNPQAYRYLRFTVNETYQNRSAEECGYPYFAISEFGLTEAGADLDAFELLPQYATLDRNLVTDVRMYVRQVEEARDSTFSTLGAACERLEAAYRALLLAAHHPGVEYGVAEIGAPEVAVLQPWKIYALRYAATGSGLRFGREALAYDAATHTGQTDEALSQIFRFEPADFVQGTYRLYNPAAGKYLAPLAAVGAAAAYVDAADAAGKFRVGMILNGYCYLEDADSRLLLGAGADAPAAARIAVPAGRTDAGSHQLCEVSKGSEYTYRYTVGGVQAETSRTAFQKWGVAPVHPHASFAFAECTNPEGADDVVLGPKTLQVSVEEHLPFTKSEDFDHACWHSVEMHWTDNGALANHTLRYTWTYRADNAGYNLQMPKIGVSHYKALMDERRQWCFVGNVVDGFRIYNRAAGADYTVRKPLAGETLASLSTDDGRNRFLLHASALGLDTAACFRLPDDTHYLNSHTNSGTDRIISGWTAADGGSSCRFQRIDDLCRARWAVALDSAAIVRGEWANGDDRLAGYATSSVLEAQAAAMRGADGSEIAPADVTLGLTEGLEAANAACMRQVRLPQAGRQYMIISANESGNRNVEASAMTAAVGSNSPGWEALDRTSENQRWHLLPSADGNTFSLEPVARPGQYVAIGSAQNNKASLSATATAFELDVVAPGQFALRESVGHFALNERNWADAGYTSSSLVNWNANPIAGSPSAWRIEEVAHEVTIGATGYATLYLGHTADVPAGVTASAALLRDDQTGARLQSVGSRLAAETAVVLQGAPGSYVFRYTDAEAAAPEANSLRGWSETTRVSSDEYCYYALRNSKSLGVGFYVPTVYEESGTTWTFTADARKAYLEVPRRLAQSNRFFGFLPDPTTGIGEAAADGAAVPVYDLSGRRVRRAGRGLYISGGKKIISK